MQKWILALGAVALAGCQQAAEDDAAVDDAAEDVVVSEPTAPDGGPFAGTFILTDADGVEYENVINADGTFSIENGDGTTTTGSYEVNDTGFCLTIDGDDENAPCITSSEVAEDGTWVNTNPEGESFTLRRVEPTADE